MLNDDYRDILRAFSTERVRFLLVGAYAMAAHGYPRATMDIDLWIDPSADNVTAVLRALEQFGAPMDEISAKDLSEENLVFQIGVAPRRIDVLTGVSGLTFADAYANSIEIDIEGTSARVLCLNDLIKNKRASGRKQDAADLEVLESLRDSNSETN